MRRRADTLNRTQRGDKFRRVIRKEGDTIPAAAGLAFLAPFPIVLMMQIELVYYPFAVMLLAMGEEGKKDWLNVQSTLHQ